ncbi:MAG TPA: type II secretion system protein [Marinagarivorans sp.]
MRLPRSNAGFTLVELIAVIVVLAITAVVGAGFIVDVVDQYQKAQLRSTLVQRGTVTLEQLTRKLRMSVPNSLRVSGSGQCIEYLPLIGGAFYTAELPDADNGRPAIAAVPTIEFTIEQGAPSHVLVSPMNTTEIYTVATPSARIGAGDFGPAPYAQAVFSANHVFNRNSTSRRLLLAKDPERFCLVGTTLVRYQGYGLDTSAINDASPAGVPVIMATGVTSDSNAFALSPGSEDRNAVIDVSLRFSDRGESVQLNSRVLIRNVP